MIKKIKVKRKKTSKIILNSKNSKKKSSNPVKNSNKPKLNRLIIKNLNNKNNSNRINYNKVSIPSHKSFKGSNQLIRSQKPRTNNNSNKTIAQLKK